MPKISAIGVGIPENSYSQEHIFRAMGHRRIYNDLFLSAGIEKRHLCLDPAEIVKTSPQEQHEHARRFALELSLRSVQDCLARRGVKPTDIDALVFVSCTVAFQSPALNWEIAHALGMRDDVIHVPISGAGCAGAGPGLRRAWEFVRLYPLGRVLVVTTEVSAAAYHPSTDLGVVLGNSLFADGSSCYLVEGGGLGLSLLDFVEFHDYEHLEAIALIWADARFKIVLPMRAPELTTPMVKRVVASLLRRGQVGMGEISHFLFHSGGRSILQDAERELAIPREKLEHSYWVWRNYGNMSSATVGFAFRHLWDNNTLKDGDHIIMVTLGAGLTGQGALMVYSGG